MTPATLMQLSSPQRLDAIQRHMNRGGGGAGVLLALLGLAALVALILAIHALQQRARGCDVDRPGKLYRKVVRGLNLSVPQRDLLLRITRDLRLGNPTVMLLGRRIFETYTKRWAAAGRTIPGADVERRIAHLAEALFPPPQGQTISTSHGEPATPQTTA